MNRLLTVCAVSLALCGGMPAEAASVTYFLDQSNALADGPEYLSVTVDDAPPGAPAGTIGFTVDVDETLFPNRVGAFGIKTFAFNRGSGILLEKSNITVEGRPADSWKILYGKNLSEFGGYDVVLDFDKVKEAGEAAKSWPDPLAFRITGIDGDSVSSYTVNYTADDKRTDFFFAAHVAGFAPSGTTSAWFAGPDGGGGFPAAVVPIPAAAPLFGSALLGLWFAAARRRTHS